MITAAGLVQKESSRCHKTSADPSYDDDRAQSEQRINSLAAWRETTLCSERERAALAWAEAVAAIAKPHAPDHLYQALMNAWNRLGVSFRMMVQRAELANAVR